MPDQKQKRVSKQEVTITIMNSMDQPHDFGEVIGKIREAMPSLNEAAARFKYRYCFEKREMLAAKGIVLREDFILAQPGKRKKAEPVTATAFNTKTMEMMLRETTKRIEELALAGAHRFVAPEAHFDSEPVHTIAVFDDEDEDAFD